MTIDDIYNLAIQIGIDRDIKKEDELNNLRNSSTPYSDSGIMRKKSTQEIKRIAVGIDISPFDIFFAKTVLHCDLFLSHHPISKAAGEMFEIVQQQTANLDFYGVPKTSVEDEINNAAIEIQRRTAGDNLYQKIQIAEYLDIDILCLHTPIDNITVSVLSKIASLSTCETLGDFVHSLTSIEEFEMATLHGQKPFIAAGKETDALGSISFSEFVGGEESSNIIFKAMKNADINTIVVPHLSEDFFEEAKRVGLQVIYCGHYATDSIGMNHFLDKLLSKDNTLEIFPLGGLLRKML